MNNRIFVINSNQELISMSEAPYDTEDLLQSLLANHPAILASDQIGDSQRQWILVSRETPVPDFENGSGRWSLDHLFLDQDGIPTLVEVKRSTDTRIRREVVGQMLDYAANAVVYWRLDEIRARFEARCEANGISPDQLLYEQLGVEDAGDYWELVKTNLRAGKVRLLFVADTIPHELQRIIEFLNKQMSPAEVLGIEVKQYVSDDLKTLVPNLIGQTAETKQIKSEKSVKQWDAEAFFNELATQIDEETAIVAQYILEWALARNLDIWWGKGEERGSFFPRFFKEGTKHFIVSLWTAGGVEVQFQHMRPPFDTLEMKTAFMERLNQIEGATITESSLNGRPTFPIKVLSDKQNMEKFIQAVEWFIETIKMHD